MVGSGGGGGQGYYILGNMGVPRFMASKLLIRIHRRCSGRDHPDGINNCRVQVYHGLPGGGIFGPNNGFLIGRDGGLSTEWTS